MLELECQSYGFKAGFSVSGLESKNLPYSIRFSGPNSCGTINKTSSDHISNGRIWIWTNYTDCGVEAYHVGESIAFEQTLIVDYRSKDHSSVVYRYISSSYKVKCFLDRRVIQKLEINVKDITEENPETRRYHYTSTPIITLSKLEINDKIRKKNRLYDG